MAKDINLKKSKTITTSYGFGLFIDEDSLLGRFVSHSGGYPGFGSHMRWHPQSGYGVIALGNLTYAPMNELATEVMNKIVVEVNALPATKELDIWKSTQNAVETVVRLLNKWDENIADKNFAMNVDMDKLVKEIDLSSLETLLNNITYANLDKEDMERLGDAHFVKLFRMSQLTIA